MSDLDYPRRSLYDRLYPKQPDMATILHFVRGESLHSFFRDVLGQLSNSRIEQKGVDVTPDGHELIHHPDVMFVEIHEWPFPIVWEFKTTLGAKPAKHWVWRTHRYMASEDVEHGVLAVHYLLRNELKCYPMYVPSSRLRRLKDGVLYLTDLFERGLVSGKNPFPKCADCSYRGASCRHRHLCIKDGIDVKGVGFV